MDRRTLVTLDRLDIEEGQKLLDVLDHSDLSVAAAFWYYMDGPEMYRLMIATPYYDKHGPRKTYKKIQEAIQKSKTDIDLGWATVSVLGLKDQTVRTLKCYPGATHFIWQKNN